RDDPRQLRPCSVDPRRLQAYVPAAGELVGERVALEELVQSRLVLPGGDQPDAPWGRRGQQPCAQRRERGQLGVAKAVDVAGAQARALEPHGAREAEVCEVHGDDHGTSPFSPDSLLLYSLPNDNSG